MIKTFINRPVLSTVISIIILLLGVLGMKLLPVTQYPDIAPPTIKISAKYTGADAQTVLQSVIIPIEEQVNGVEDMTYITSSADNSGAASITVYFKQGVDPDIATVNVQNRVSRATPSLPSDVVKSGVVTQKQQTSSLMFLSFYSKNKAYDDVFIQNYLNINIIPAIKRINGVGDATVFGAKDYSMRIWLDPQKMSNFNLVPADVIKTINEQSTQAAIGQLAVLQRPPQAEDRLRVRVQEGAVHVRVHRAARACGLKNGHRLRNERVLKRERAAHGSHAGVKGGAVKLGDELMQVVAVW